MEPRSEDGSETCDNSIPARTTLLNKYIEFLTMRAQHHRQIALSKTRLNTHISRMAADFDRSDPASPLAYNASQTALLLMDFQDFIVNRCGPTGQSAVATAKTMRDWALNNRIMVVHSVIDIQAKPPQTYKGADRIATMMNELAKDPDLAREPPEIAFDQSEGEYIVLKRPGQVSALKSAGAMDLLTEYDVRSLILCGLSTSGAVLRTASPAVDEGFVVSVIEDGCGDPNEGLHDMLMKSALPSGAHVVKAKEFIERWEGDQPA